MSKIEGLKSVFLKDLEKYKKENNSLKSFAVEMAEEFVLLYESLWEDDGFEVKSDAYFKAKKFLEENKNDN